MELKTSRLKVGGQHFVLNVCTFRLVSLASTSTGVPIAPKAVATLLAIRLTVAEKIGLNPKLIRMAAGMATAVPNPAIASSNPPNPPCKQ